MPPSEPHDLASSLGTGLSPDVGQIELFADRVVLARDLDLALEAGRFVEAVTILDAIEEAFGLSTHSSWRPWISRLAAATWEETPAGALDTWAEVDEQLAREPALQRPAFTGAFTRLLRSHSPQALGAARPRSLPALFRALASGLGRRPEEGLIEARGLVRDALLADRSLEALDFQTDTAVADLLAEDLAPRWLACLGRLRRLWLGSPLHGTELSALAPLARGEGGEDDPASSFWHCLRLAEFPDCPDELRQQARRRMKQLNPDFHALLMRRTGAL